MSENLKRYHTILIIILLLLFWSVVNVNIGSISLAETNLTQQKTNVNAENPGSITFPQYEGPLLLDTSLPKTRFYLGERSPIQITLYIKDLNNVEVDKPYLNQSEFILDELSQSHKVLKVNGEECNIVIFSYLLTPLKTGTFIFGPVHSNCTIFMSNGRKGQLDAVSQKISVRVLPLPQSNQPSDFSGAIGNFQLDVGAEPLQVLQGEPLTIQLALSGSGSLQNIMPPYLKNTQGLKVYPAQKKPELTNSSGSWEKVVFEQTVFPVVPNLKSVGPYTFTYFEPSSGKYHQLSSGVIPITVKPNPKLKPETSDLSVSLADKLLPIKITPGQLTHKAAGLLDQPWFWLGQLLPILFLGGIFFYRRHLDWMKSDSLPARTIRAYNKAVRKLSKTEAILNSQNHDQLLDELHLTLREYLGERFNLPVAGMTGTVVHSLERQGVATEILKDIQWFFEQYDLYRFTGIQLDPDESLKLWKLISLIVGELNQGSSQSKV